MTVLAMLLALSLVSCRKDEQEYLSVTSTDYVNLERLELCSLDEQEILDVWESNAYDAYYCFVSKTNTYGDQPERLVVNIRVPNISIAALEAVAILSARIIPNLHPESPFTHIQVWSRSPVTNCLMQDALRCCQARTQSRDIVMLSPHGTVLIRTEM